MNLLRQHSITIKLYLVPFILFCLTGLTAELLNIGLTPYIGKKYSEIVLWTFVLSTFIIFIYAFGKGEWKLLKYRKINSNQVWLIIFLLGLFVINNFLIASFSKNQYFENEIKNSLSVYILAITISSITEEVIYRGFIQTYINEKIETSNSIISIGNTFASILMVITHFGFFKVMDPFFAVTGLMLVAIYSFTAGYLRDKTGGILVPIIIHIFYNYVHTFIIILFSK